MNYDYLEGWRKRALKRTEGRGAGLEFFLNKPEAENDIIVDLHIHSKNSDGRRTLQMIGKDATANGVSKLAFADHDTIKALNDLRLGKSDLADYKGEVLNGVEITSRLDGETIEILGYDFDLDKANEFINSGKFPFLNRQFKLKKFVDLISKRIEIVNKMGLTDKPLSINDFIDLELPQEDGTIKKVPLSSLHIDISKAMHLASKEGRVVEFINVNKKKTHLNFDYFNSKLYKFISEAKAGQEFLKNYEVDKQKSISNFSEFNRFLILRNDSPLYVDDSAYFPTVKQTCDFVKEAGGVPILAHPYGYGALKISPEDIIERSLKYGIDGIECMHGFNEPDQIEKIYKYCYEHDLLISAGSDVHEYYSYQGGETSPGLMSGQGVNSKFKNNILESIKIGTYNVHLVGSGAWRGEKSFDVDGLQREQ